MNGYCSFLQNGSDFGITVGNILASTQSDDEVVASRNTGQLMLKAFQLGKTSVTDELVFPSEAGTPICPDNIGPRYMEPTQTHTSRTRRAGNWKVSFQT